MTHLLDLKQKHANAFEARFARDQAALTARQGQTIMVFTIVTIIFLPMSFIASIFSIDIREFPQQSNQTSLPIGYVAKYTFGIGLGISIPLILLAFSVEDVLSVLRRWIATAYHGIFKPLFGHKHSDHHRDRRHGREFTPAPGRDYESSQFSGTEKPTDALDTRNYDGSARYDHFAQRYRRSSVTASVTAPPRASLYRERDLSVRSDRTSRSPASGYMGGYAEPTHLGAQAPSHVVFARSSYDSPRSRISIGD